LYGALLHTTPIYIIFTVIIAWSRGIDYWIGKENCFVKKQANSNQCFVCGVNNSFGLKIKFYEPQPGEVEAEIKLPKQYQGYPGVVHGGREPRLE
jgi:hypothetical protein